MTSCPHICFCFFKTVFLARGVGSSLQIANTTVAENRLARDWTGVSASQGSSVSVLDSSFENNEGIEVRDLKMIVSST